MPGQVVQDIGQDLAEAIAFAAAGKVRAHARTAAPDDVDSVFAELKAGRVTGRIVLKLDGQ